MEWKLLPSDSDMKLLALEEADEIQRLVFRNGCNLLAKSIYLILQGTKSSFRVKNIY